ncbi:MAG: hypothetical protein KF850_01800 [Labilithrix sp.]|nr:hypothetical protein [Labilithrix sp.]
MSRPPKLDEAILTDDTALGDAIDKVLLASEEFRRLSGRIRRRQRELQQLVDQEGWRAYLHLEVAVNERGILESELIARWAFRAGLKLGRREAHARRTKA